jgi:hypothetical protein
MIKIEDIVQVYSGRNGACFCGCSGIHRYPASMREEGAEHRGYALDDKDINDRHVNMVVDIINAGRNGDGIETTAVYVSRVIDDKIYVAYFRKHVAEQRQVVRATGLAKLTDLEKQALGLGVPN